MWASLNDACCLLTALEGEAVSTLKFISSDLTFCLNVKQTSQKNLEFFILFILGSPSTFK